MDIQKMAQPQPRVISDLENVELAEFCENVKFAGNDLGALVVIARRMPRILELSGPFSNLPCPVISERALPWVNPEILGRMTLLFVDDIWNVGSTLAHHINYARQERGFSDI